jgi:hypothetical protein
MNEIEMGPSSTFPKRRVVTGGVVLALALVVGSVAVLAGRNGTPTGNGLPLLPAAASAPTSSGVGAMSAQSGRAQATAIQSYPQAVTYRLQGTLPALASHAPAYRLDKGVTEAAVTRLARALGINGPVKAEPNGWTATDGTQRLEVSKDNAGEWFYSPGNSCGAISAPRGLGAASMMCVSGGSGSASASGTVTSAGTTTTAHPSAPVPTTTGPGIVPGSAQATPEKALPAQGAPNQASPPQNATTPPSKAGQVLTPPVAIACPMPACPPGSSCPVSSCPPRSGCGSSGCPVPPRAADLATPEHASQAARDLLVKAGIDVQGAAVKAFAEPMADLVTVNPTIDGLPTAGMAYVISFGPKGVVQYANGVLAGPSKLGDYPLVGTAEGFKRMQAGRGLLEGGIRPMMAAGAPTGFGDMAPSRQITITGAHLALVRVFGADSQTYLEPAYVFETAAPSFTPPVAAVADKLLQIAPANGPRILAPQPLPVTPVTPGGPLVSPGVGGTTPTTAIAPSSPVQSGGAVPPTAP